MPFCEILEPGGLGAGYPALSSPRLPPSSQSGCERRFPLSLRKQGAAGPGRRAPLWFSAFSRQRPPFLSPTKLELLPHGPSSSSGAKWGAASPTSSLLPKLIQTNSI